MSSTTHAISSTSLLSHFYVLSLQVHDEAYADHIMQLATNLAQRIYADSPSDGGFNRVIRRERAPQMRLQKRLEDLGFDAPHEGQVLFDDGSGRPRYDLYVDGHVVIELKWVNKLTSVHRNQMYTYMQGLQCKYGVLINFPNCWRSTVEAEKSKYENMEAHPGRWDMAPHII